MNRKLRLHVLGIPHTKTTEEYVACAYTQKALKFCKMMTQRGHTVFHYGVEGSNPICTEQVDVVSAELHEQFYGQNYFKKEMFRYNINDLCYKTFIANSIAAIRKRLDKNDILLPFWGAGVKEICDALKDECIVIEPGIGYGYGMWADYKVFESYAIYHAYCGISSVAVAAQNNYEVVIPNYFDLKDFNFNPKSRHLDKNNRYFCFVGRVISSKGVRIAISVCRSLGIKLKIAGQLSGEFQNFNWPDGVEFVGHVDIQQRNELMKNAIACFVPSQYVEPFGGVQIESLLCGTPTITSDWGAFAENNIHEVTGYRCRTFDDYLNAALNCLEGKINLINCRKQGLNFSLEAIAPKYEKFFNDVVNIYEGRGWNEINPDTISRILQLKQQQ